jgi:hypothetical protein
MYKENRKADGPKPPALPTAMRGNATRLASQMLLVFTSCAIACLTFVGCDAHRDNRDWSEAKGANTADSYIAYLVSHPDGAFVSEARKEARKFLTVKYVELPQPGEVLITSELGNMTLYGISDDSAREEHTVTHVRQDGSEITFDKIDFQFRFGNAVLQPRSPDASIYMYDDRKKGVKFSGFDILLRGTSQSVPIFPISDNNAAPPPVSLNR